MGTSERRIELIKLLCLRRHETMTNLAFEFGVSVRTIKRDIDEITAVIPIYIKSGRYGGGVYVMEQFKLNNTYFNNQETELLKKIIKYFINENESFLDNNEINLLENIVHKYSFINI